MFVSGLKLVSFRNFESENFTCFDGINVFYGKNGSGKTNLLEAIFTLLLGRSQRGAPDKVLLREGDSFYRLKGKVSIDNRIYDNAIAYQLGGRKKITVDLVSIRAVELFERHSVVSSAPEDIAILSGPPACRRDFINLYLSQASAKYLDNLSSYQKTLAQKNAFLKQENNSGDTSYDDLLVEYGADIIFARRQFLETIREAAAPIYEKISKGYKFEIRYNPSVPLTGNQDSLDRIKSAFKDKLRRYRERERILQTSLVGPHRDEIDFQIGDYPARAYGSQGELRTATIALKMGVFEYLKSVRRETPILLLDEIFAELDESRKELLVESFGQVGQLFLTSATGLPESLSGQSSRIQIERGHILDTR